MSVMSPNETRRNWRQYDRAPVVQIYLSDTVEGASALVGARVAGFQVAVTPLSAGMAIDADSLAGAAAAVIQVSPDDDRSLERFRTLAQQCHVPLIAAVYSPSLVVFRALVRSGAHDVVALPLEPGDLEASLAPIRDALSRQDASVDAATGKLVSIVKTVGGVGATAILGQLALRFAEKEAAHGREVCLIDLDLQFGDAAFQLGIQSKLSISDLIEAGTRLDGALLRATTVEHPSGLKVIASPPDILPLESLSDEQVFEIVDLAKREFGTVFVDLPSNWTNWSLSLLAQSDLVLLVTEISVTSLSRARKQMDFIQRQEMGDLEIRVVANRFEKGQLKAIRAADIRQALGRDIAVTIANEPGVIRPAIEQGVPLAEIKRKSAIGHDLDLLDAEIAATLGRRR